MLGPVSAPTALGDRVPLLRAQHEDGRGPGLRRGGHRPEQSRRDDLHSVGRHFRSA